MSREDCSISVNTNSIAQASYTASKWVAEHKSATSYRICTRFAPQDARAGSDVGTRCNTTFKPAPRLHPRYRLCKERHIPRRKYRDQESILTSCGVESAQRNQAGIRIEYGHGSRCLMVILSLEILRRMAWFGCPRDDFLPAIRFVVLVLAF
jgi:hypothetical protein